MTSTIGTNPDDPGPMTIFECLACNHKWPQPISWMAWVERYLDYNDPSPDTKRRIWTRVGGAVCGACRGLYCRQVGRKEK